MLRLSIIRSDRKWEIGMGSLGLKDVVVVENGRPDACCATCIREIANDLHGPNIGLNQFAAGENLAVGMIEPLSSSSIAAEIETAFDRSSDGLCIVSGDYTITSINRTLLNMVGTSRSEAVGRKCHEILSDELCSGDPCPLKRIMGGEESVACEFDRRNRKWGSSDRIYELRAWPYCDRKGRQVGVVQSFRDITGRVDIAKWFEDEHASRQRKDTAIREVMTGVSAEIEAVGQRILDNIDKLIMPIIHDLEREIPASCANHIELLKKSLVEISSPFSKKLSTEFRNLTPAELRICHLMRQGLSSKEIARIEHISPGTVSRHREHIRRKCGLTNSKMNLRVYLEEFAHNEGKL